MATADDVLKLAEQQIGITESPRDSNCQKFSKKVGRPCQAWCADAVVWLMRQVGIKLPSESAYTPTMADGFKRAGRWTDTPAAGRVAFFDFPDRQMGIQHVGIVRTDQVQPRVQTYEGNTSSGDGGSQDNGGGFYARERNPAHIVGYGIPDYEAVDAPAAVHLSDEEAEMGAVIQRLHGGFIAVGNDGSITAYDGAPSLGSIPDLNLPAALGSNIVGGAWTMSGNGYWLTAADGAIYSFGDAQYHGGFNALPPDVRRTRFIVGMAATPDGGYTQVAYDPSNDGSPYDAYHFV
ncbi:MAG TPA: CHAP domain-containing protein [Actinomycetota bacterium]|nr:CHAP domain-containing protein [Actinomycetota bacterium]